MKLAFILFSLWVTCVASKEIIVGQNEGGWSVGVTYAPINAVVGDQLVRRISSKSVTWS